MFTGIIEAIGSVKSIEKLSANNELIITANNFTNSNTGEIVMDKNLKFYLLNDFKNYGLIKVTDTAELSIRGQGNTDDTFFINDFVNSGDGKIYTLAEAEGVLPEHPNCEGSWVAAV